MLKDVDNFTQEIESMSEKINLSLFEDFFESSSPVDYAKMLINTSPDENKKIVAETKYRISDLKDRIKKMSEKEKKNADETRDIIKKFLEYNINAPNYFQFASKVNKKIRTKKESIAERVKLRRQKLNIAAKKKENINNVLFNYYFDYSNPEIMFKRLRDASDEKNKNLVESINKKLTKMKNIVKNVPKDEVSRVEENEKIIDIVEKILELNSKKQSGKGLKNF